MSRLFILRPVGTSLLMLALFLVGLVAYRFLPVSALPEVDYPTIQVSTFYPGAGPDVMAASVTAPLERQFGQMPGLAQMASTSAAGASVITLRFDLSLALDVAEQEVQAGINGAGNLLPADLPAPPIYAKVNPADAPVMTLALTSKVMPLTQLEDLADTRLAGRISQLPGVGLVSIAGGNRPAVRVRVNPLALAKYGLAVDDVRTTLANANTNSPKGGFDGPDRAATIAANDQITGPDQYADTILAYRDGAPVRLRDVATVARGPENVALAAWANRAPAILLQVRRQPGANVLAVADSIRALLPRLEPTLPRGLELAVITDRTGSIRASVRDAALELGLAVALVVGVLWLFLHDGPSTLIPALSVPLSLMGALAGMYLLGFGIDNLSLMSLTIAAGFVVDDAIVMIENIARFAEAGRAPLQAALEGAAEIGFTILSLTVSLIAVLIPLLFMGDVVGRLFHEFAVTLAITIALSAGVSLTLVPMMAARLLRPHAGEARGRLARGVDEGFGRLVRGYDRALGWTLERPVLGLAVFAFTLATTAMLYLGIPKSFFPVQDTGAVQAIVEGPPDISFARLSELQHGLADRILADPAVRGLTSFLGVDGQNLTPNTGRLLIDLKPKDERDPVAAVIARLRDLAATIPGLSLHAQAVQDLTIDSAVGRAQYRFLLENPDSAALRLWTPRLLARLRQSPLLRHVATDLAGAGGVADLVIDRATAARFGITPASVDNALYDLFGQRIVSTIFTQSNQYRVILEAAPDLRKTLRDLDSIYLPSSLSGQVPLRAVVHVGRAEGPLQISHLGQFPAATVSFDLAPGVSLGDGLAAVRAAREAIGLPGSFTLALQGTAAAFEASLGNQLFLLLAAVLAVYIVLGVLYESVVHPVTILSTLPSAGIGALLALWLAGHDLDIIGIIGIVLLIGIVKKNAIMMVDFALEAQRGEGLAARPAIHRAALLRFRPILMTTMAAGFGALPLVLGGGDGAELRRPLGLAITGGLAVSQVLTLFSTPVIYEAFDRVGRWRRG